MKNMSDKVKRILTIIACAAICVALAVVIGGRFTRVDVSDEPRPDVPDPQASISVDAEQTGASPKPVELVVDARPAEQPKPTSPGAGADSTGTEQTIQAAPVKPEPPEPPTPIAEDHDAEDIPEDERNTEAPPTYAPEQTTVTTPEEPNAGSTNEIGAVYVPGFGYIESSGEGTVTHADDMYENGNKVGIMD